MKKGYFNLKKKFVSPKYTLQMARKKKGIENKDFKAIYEHRKKSPNLSHFMAKKKITLNVVF